MCTQTQLKKLSVHTFPDSCYVNDITCIAFCMLQFPWCTYIYIIHTHMYILNFQMHTHIYMYIYIRHAQRADRDLPVPYREREEIIYMNIYIIFTFLDICTFRFTYTYQYMALFMYLDVWHPYSHRVQAGGGASPELFEELCQKAARRCRLWTISGLVSASFQLV